VDEPQHTEDAELLGIYLATRDVPCPRCRYNLRGLTVTRCPECGQELSVLVTIASVAVPPEMRPQRQAGAPHGPLPPLPKLRVVEVSRLDLWARRTMPAVVALGVACGVGALLIGVGAWASVATGLVPRRYEQNAMILGTVLILSAVISLVAVRAIGLAAQDPPGRRIVRAGVAWGWLPVAALCAALLPW
jgi:hypothetical protein